MKLWPLLGLLGVACVPVAHGVEKDSLERAQDFFPDTFEMPVTMRLASVSIDANAKMTVEGNDRVISITKDGVMIEQETFVVTTGMIAVKQLGTGETFEPPLVLVEFPSAIGDTFQWDGKIGLAGPEIAAKAAIATSRDRPDTPSGPQESLKVAVVLEIDDGSPRPAVRKIDFWFAEGIGPFRRDYGNQLRTPR